MVREHALLVFMVSTFFSMASVAANITVVDASGQPLATAMVTRSLANPPVQNTQDDGYPPHGTDNQAAGQVTGFTDSAGQVVLPAIEAAVQYRVRKPGFSDAFLEADGRLTQTVSLQAVNNAVEQVLNQPPNTWLSVMDFDGDRELQKQFQLNCAFCHQQATAFMRAARTPEQWVDVFNRMETYGSRLPEDDKLPLANILSREYQKLSLNPSQVPLARAWEAQLNDAAMTEWALGDAFSQMHDFIVHPNGFVYVGDNLQDRIYEVNPETGEYQVYKVPREESMGLGGILGNRFKTYGKVSNYMGVHSFAISPVDGNIFITPSMQQALLEFNPDTKEFTVHKMDEGYYPHTIRADEKDRIWFTLALSSQVAMWDRKEKQFTVYDLPARSFKEWVTIKLLPLIFSIPPEYRPQPTPDRKGTGLPMPYGIDVAPDGKIWVARLYGDDIGVLDPDTGDVKMIETPYSGPRRLRIDADGDIWIVAFQDSKLLRYQPQQEAFTSYDLPVVNELPYALNVDRKRGEVWLNGNQSDSIMRFTIATEQWEVFPMPRRRFFSRDIEIGEDGSVYTTNSHFPSWHIEGAQPTLLRLQLGRDQNDISLSHSQGFENQE